MSEPKDLRTSNWEVEDCMAALLANLKNGDGWRERHLRNLDMKVTMMFGLQRMRNMFRDNPVPVNAPPLDQLAESLAYRKSLCRCDQSLQQEKVFFASRVMIARLSVRLFVHIYAFLVFEDCKQDLWTKRFVGNHLYYKDKI
jgi:hypothetical protein